MLLVKNENACEEQSNVLDSFRDSESNVSPVLLKRSECTEKKKKRNRFFSLLWYFKALAIFTAQTSALVYTTSGGPIRFIMAEIHYVLNRKLIWGRHAETVLFLVVLPQHTENSQCRLFG